MAAGGPLPDLAGKTASKVVGTVVEPVRHAPGRAVIILVLSQVGTETSSEKIKGRIRVVWREPDVNVRQGDPVTFMTQLKAPPGLSNPGRFDYADYLERQGIKAVASLSGPGQVRILQSDVSLSLWSPLRWFDTWRDRIREAATRSLHEPALGLYLSMLIGEPDYITPEMRDLFMTTGTVHILSISGSHLGLIACL